MSLNGAHALVTGGGTGIGLAIARGLAAQGTLVTITGRRIDVLQDVAGDGLYALAMDVTDESAQRDTIAKAVAARGPIQICVANAGIAEGRALQKTEMDLWRRIMTTNLDGAFITIRESMRSMVQAGKGDCCVLDRGDQGVEGRRGLCRQQTWFDRVDPLLF